MSADGVERDYEVGYGKTPTHTRFKPGRSGNPSGRKKKVKSAQELVVTELNKSVPIMENGKRIKATKLDIIIKQLINAAVKGDTKQLLQFIKSLGLDLTGEKAEKNVDPLDSAEDLATRENLIRRLRGQS